MDDWKEVTLADIADIVPGFAFKGSDFGTVGQSVIKIKDIVPPIIDILHTNKIDIKKYNKHKIDKYKIKKNDFVVAMTGATIGKVGILTREIEAYVNQRVAIIKPHDNMSKEFVYYTTQITEFYNHIKNNIDSNSAQENISGNSIGKYIIYIPSLDYQNRIVDILSPLDHKIELNRQMNETLEQMAQAVFQDWFVDFGPVKRKAKGITDPVAILGGLIPNPAQAQKIASLFPDQFAEDGLPEGCSMGSISTYAELNPESWSAKKHPNVIQYVDLSNTKFGIIKHIQSYSWYKAPSRAKRILIKGDTVIGTVRPDNGAYSLIHTSGLTASTGFAVLRPKEYDFRSFIYCAITRADNIAHLAFLADGGAYPAVTPEQVLDTQVSILHRSILDCFNNIANNLFDLYAHNTDQNHTLAEMRDLLLPKLMSGEISVDELEKKMGGVL